MKGILNYSIVPITGAYRSRLKSGLSHWKCAMPDVITLHSVRHPAHHPDPLQPIRQWLDHIQLHKPQTARLLAKLIPGQCPFERDITILGKTLLHIPPLCKLNPLYEELVSLRFRCLCYLADQCGEDINSYL